VFTAIERRSRDPLVPFGIFSSRALRRANIGAVALFGTYISFQFLVTQYLQTLSRAWRLACSRPRSRSVAR
jgi:hypothetical protein